MLFTTAYIREKSDIYNWMQTNVTYKSRLHAERSVSAGLRFIKQNVPQIEILEYPLWDEFIAKLREGWDIVGFSFFLNETHEVIRMVNKAREMGIKEIWGGNYGVLTKEVQPYFDRIFIGYSEHEIAKALGHEVKEIIHPPLIVPAGIPGLNLNWMGVLFTTRGCTVKCTFCQSPSFEKKVKKIPIESIERVLAFYKKMGVGNVVILDEYFGMVPKHADAVVALFKKYKLLWWTMTRADFITKKLDAWDDGKLGLAGVGLGLESFDPEVLEKINKKEEAEEVVSSVKEVQKRGIGVIGYYMIGFDIETRDSIKQSLRRLGELKLDATQLCIITPLPQTPLWDDIEENYGIFEKDWHKFNTKHLVWNHPTIPPKEMEELLYYGFNRANPRRTVLRRLRKIMVGTVKTKGYSGVGEMIKNLYRSNVVFRRLYQPVMFDGHSIE
ncbi:MAG: radical SAM protein [Methanomassiliicoccales archaeon]|nr:MAG: radical SAM protein [Methanomassiliicoccales archaeon]